MQLIFLNQGIFMSDKNDEQKQKEDTKDTIPKEPSRTNDTSSEHHGNIQKAVCQQIIKSVWTHEPWLYFKVIVKSNEEMGEYIALHGLVPQNELPLQLRYKIPENEIWIRENVYADAERRKSILAHEYAELDLMITRGIGYKEAHEQAEFIEHLYYPSELNTK
jgi:hypothetical protein